MTDIEIAHNTKLIPIAEVASKAGIPEKYFIPYGKNRAKIDFNYLNDYNYQNHHGKVVLVTATNPTPMGEGKTTTTIGLTDAFNQMNVNAIAALREPSLGPVFGLKGGATGGGHAQVAPMEDINLHFNGDFHAIESANNLIAAMIDNHIYHGNELRIDPKKITWRRCVDMNDRQLRNVVDGLGGKVNGCPREDGYDITVASEIMASFCLARDLDDLHVRIARTIVAYTYDGDKVTVSDLKATGAVMSLLVEAFSPNLVQTLEGNPVIIHGGPFANIAHGCNSIVATKTAMKLADVVVTEAGFGADLGAEKFMDIKCRAAGIVPSAIVLVTTIRSIKYRMGYPVDKCDEPINKPFEFTNLLTHAYALRDNFNIPTVITINRFDSDTDEEIKQVVDYMARHGFTVTVCEGWAKGGEGALELAKTVEDIISNTEPSEPIYNYGLSDSIEDKIRRVAHRSYGILESNVSFDPVVYKKIEEIKDIYIGLENGSPITAKKLPICIAKTQYTLGTGTNGDVDTLTVKDIKLCAGAGFIVVYTGNIMTMPGLPKSPAAERITVDKYGVIDGIF